MGRSKWFGRMFAGALVALVAALGLTSAGASASSPAARRGAALAAQAGPQVCAAERTATVTGVTVTIEPCQTWNYDTINGIPWLSPATNLAFSTDPNEPVDLCRVTIHFQTFGGSYGNNLVQQEEFACMNAVQAGTGFLATWGTFSDPASPVTSLTGWVTVELASVDGPVQVVSHRYAFTGPFVPPGATLQGS